MNNCIFVIFGGTGDLAKRKLIPSLYNLYVESKTPQNFRIVSIGRKDYNIDSYRELIKESTAEFSNDFFNIEKWNDFKEKVFYNKFDFSSDCEGYSKLELYLKDLDEKYVTEGNRIFYLAVPPSSFEMIIKNLKTYNMLENNKSWQRVMIEKPFGSNLETARKLNESISKYLPEDKIFRIDHYLGKEMIQNILAIRFGNTVYEPLWNNKYIDNIQIILSEDIGVGNRGKYYEKAGVIKDMLQNHILQMLSLISMEPPLNLKPESIRDEKVKAIKALRLYSDESAKENIVMGQYGKTKTQKAYREEENVNPKSNTATFIALRAYVDNERWKGVPFYIKVGKLLQGKCAKIVIQFKKLPNMNNYVEFKDNKPNLLVIKIQPKEGIFFQMNAKEPGNEFKIKKVSLDYCQKSEDSSYSTKAYERLIIEGIRNNPSLFARWDELEYSWKFTESIENSIKDVDFDFPNYLPLSYGPEKSKELLFKEGNKWWD